MADIDLSHLEKLATDATPGPWIEFSDKGKTVAILPAGRPGHGVCEFDRIARPNAAFIAAFNPQTALALISEVKRLREALKEIAAFSDTGASERLYRTGSYAAFDEPGAAKIARAALSEVG